MVRIMENGVFSTTAASTGRLTYWFALLMVMGRTAEPMPPRMPKMHSGAATTNAASRVA